MVLVLYFMMSLIEEWSTANGCALYSSRKTTKKPGKPYTPDNRTIYTKTTRQNATDKLYDL